MLYRYYFSWSRKPKATVEQTKKCLAPRHRQRWNSNGNRYRYHEWTMYLWIDLISKSKVGNPLLLTHACIIWSSETFSFPCLQEKIQIREETTKRIRDNCQRRRSVCLRIGGGGFVLAAGSDALQHVPDGGLRLLLPHLGKPNSIGLGRGSLEYLTQKNQT